MLTIPVEKRSEAGDAQPVPHRGQPQLRRRAAGAGVPQRVADRFGDQQRRGFRQVVEIPGPQRLTNDAPGHSGGLAVSRQRDAKPRRLVWISRHRPIALVDIIDGHFVINTIRRPLMSDSVGRCLRQFADTASAARWRLRVRDSEAVEKARRALGGELAAYRRAAGYSQAEFAALVDYSRSTIANVETGRQHVPPGFWKRADAALHAGGALTEANDDLEAAADYERRVVTRAGRKTRLQHLRGADPFGTLRLATEKDQRGS